MHFHAFCDTILKARKSAVENKEQNNNKFAMVLPVKPQRIHPCIIEFVEWEQSTGKPFPAAVPVKDFSEIPRGGHEM